MSREGHVATARVDVPPMVGGTFRSLGIRNFRLFFAGQLVSQVGTWMRRIALALLVLHLTDDGVAVGVMTACQFVPMLLLGPWAGVVADRADKRRLLIVVQFVLLAQAAALAALAFSDAPPLLALYAVAVFGGVGTAFENPVRRSFVAELVPEDLIQNAVSLNSALMTGARVVGPAVAGLLISAVGFAWCFVADGFSFVGILLSLWLMRTRDLVPAPPAARGRGQVREGLRYVTTVPALSIPLVMMAVVGTFAMNFQVVLPLFATRTLGGDVSAFTWLFSILSLGSVTGALWTARKSSVDVRDVVVWAAAFGIGMFAVGLSPGLRLAYVTAAFLGLASIMFMTSATTLIQLRANPSMRGRVLALQAMVFLGSTPVGGPILGWVCERYGGRSGLYVGGLACFVAAGYGAVRDRSEPASPDTGGAVVTVGADAEGI